ncbi:MAG: DEAD/DEAH box helicase, partial [Thermomicrobium sp.]|nr:DEAD/DEAH box helicase [Thermomicrobium sp.]
MLTTGTGSGKSLAYFIPIVDWVLRNGPGKGIRAIVVYPMNALANSQVGELAKYLTHGYPPNREPVRFARFTGQEDQAERDAIRRQPPDILLTNYVMLELLLTRPIDRAVIDAAQELQFLVLDELHTYRGRQGADVAMLVRRIRERCGSETMQCIGTSATIAGGATRRERQEEVARVATQLFGQPVTADDVILETLERATTGSSPSDDDLRAALRAPIPTDYASLAANSLAVWIEEQLGVVEGADGSLERQTPRAIAEVAQDLSRRTGEPIERCRERIQATLLAGYDAKNPINDRRLFAFRLHQFISRGDTVYATIAPPDTRALLMEGQVFVPGDNTRALFPLAFCRVCGHEYYVVKRGDSRRFAPRDLSERAEENETPGFLSLCGPDDGDGPFDGEKLPEEFFEIGRDGQPKIKASFRQHVPKRVVVSPLGDESGQGTPCW